MCIILILRPGFTYKHEQARTDTFEKNREVNVNAVRILQIFKRQKLDLPFKSTRQLFILFLLYKILK